MKINKGIAFGDVIWDKEDLEVDGNIYFTYEEALKLASERVKRLPTESELELLSESPYVIKDGYCYFANSLLDLNDENKCLKLPLSGYCFESITDGVGQSAFFWSKSKKQKKEIPCLVILRGFVRLVRFRDNAKHGVLFVKP